MATQNHMTREVPQQTEILRGLRAAMKAHQTNLRLDINRLEVIVGCIANSNNNEEVVKYLSEANLSISSLRECLSTLQAHWRSFEFRQVNLDDV